MHIQSEASLPFGFNNALAELYDDTYAKMGAHSDQALDLHEGSFIAVFSCYEAPDLPPRKLVVEPKESGGAEFEIPLVHNSAVVFSLGTNQKFKHRIVLETPAGNRWLGITFRTSKTFIQFRKGQAYLEGAPLTLADDAQLKEFRKLKSRENKETDFEWPRLDYTISASDVLPPRTHIGFDAHQQKL
jgi:hypothetical protein